MAVLRQEEPCPLKDHWGKALLAVCPKDSAGVLTNLSSAEHGMRLETRAGIGASSLIRERHGAASQDLDVPKSVLVDVSWVELQSSLGLES